MLLRLDLNQNGTRWSGSGELVVWLIWIQAHESSDLWCPTAFGSEGCIITVDSYAAHEKRAQQKCINIAGGINTARAFSRSLTDLEGENQLSSAFSPCLSSFTLSVFLSLLLLAGGQIQASTGFSQRGFGSLFPRKQVRCRCHDNRHRSKRWSARAR